MELQEIEKLMAAMKQTKTKRLVIKKGEFELELEKECELPPAGSVVHPTYIPEGSEEAKMGERANSAFVKGGSATTAPPVSSDAVAAAEPEKDSIFIKSPMVGTFYISASPDEPAFVKVGDVVAPDTVVCIVEAMKVMNEVKAGVEGSVVEILVENSHPIEFGTPLFRVE